MSAAALPTSVLPRLGSLLRLLGSDVDGEALGAARALRRTLAGIGLDLHALADAVERPAAPLDELEAVRRRTRKPRRSGPGGVDLEPDRRRRVVDALSRASARGVLSSWEEDFVASVVVTLRGSRPRLSAKQFEIVERLMSKFGEGRTWA